MIFLLILGYALVIPIDVPGLVRKRCWRELIAYGVILAIAFAIVVLRMTDVKLPPLVKDTQYYVSDFFRMLHLSYD